MHTLGPGDLAFGPRDTPHAFRVDADDSRSPVVRNAGGESFFGAVGDEWEEHALPDPHPTGEQLQRLDDVLGAYDLEILGYPPFDAPE